MNLTSQYISKIAQIATLLEVSGYPKPGNVHRTHDMEDLTYEDFLISSITIGNHLEVSAHSGFECYPNMLSQIKVGELILRCIEDTQRFVKSNTNLGICMLLVPLSATFGALIHEDAINNLPIILNTIIRNSDSDDAVALTKAINMARAGGLDGKTLKYDVNDSNTLDDIRQNDINMYDLLEMSAKYDKISYELVNGLPIITEIGYPTYAKYMNDYSRNDVTLQIYLEILSKEPDTLITRKYGQKAAKNVSKDAKDILEDTSIATDERYQAIEDFDKVLNLKKYNPGTTADLTAASLFVGMTDKFSQTGSI